MSPLQLANLGTDTKYRQHAFSDMEMILNPLVTTSVAYLIFTAIGGEYSTHMTCWVFAGCIITTVVIKDIIHNLIGWMLDLDPLTANDELWLYDFPINPINIPSFLVIKKTNTDPQVMFHKMFQAIGRSHRCGVKMVKILGKYYF